MDLLTAFPQKMTGLDVEDTGEDLLIYLANRDATFHVNGTASLVLRLCDGSRNGSDIVQLLVEAYPENKSVAHDVVEVLKDLLAHGVIELV